MGGMSLLPEEVSVLATALLPATLKKNQRERKTL
jgi:hypothetical protein